MDSTARITASQPILIDRERLASLMDLDAYRDAVEAAFRAYAEGRASVPMPMHIPVDEGGFHAKGALVELDRPYVAVKVNSNFPGNPKRGLPTIQGAVLLYDAGDGRLLAVLDSIEITSKRTAAASALAAQHLARRDARTIAILGCGEQGRAQLAAIARVLPIERASAWDIDAQRAREFTEGLGTVLRRDGTPVEVSAVTDLREATRNADVIVTATSARTPFLTRGHVSPGTFVAAIGADNPHKSELDPDLFVGTKVVVDLVAQASLMGDLHHAIDAGKATAQSVHAELGDVVVGRKPGRTNDEEIAIFDSTGVAFQDVASAALAYERCAGIR